MLYIFTHVVIYLIIKEKGMIQTNPVRFVPLILLPKLQSDFLLICAPSVSGSVVHIQSITYTDSEDNTD